MAKDDFDFDDNLDWPDLDFGEPKEPSNDREPSLKRGVKQAAKGTLKAAFNEQQIRKTAKKILPGRHSDVADLAFEAKALIGDTYRQASDEVGKTKRELQRSLRGFNRQTKGMFPESVSKLIEKLGGEADSYYGGKSDEERKQEHVNSVLLEVFGEQEKERTEEKEKAAAKELRNESLSRKRYATQLEVFTGIHNQIKRVADFTSIDGRVKRKQLELQIQSNLLLGEMLESVGTMKKEMIEELKLITKNTGLPEATKINLSEEFKRVNAQRMLERVGNPIYGGLGDFLARTSKGVSRRLMNSTGNLLRGFRTNATGVLDMTGEMMSAQRDMKEMGGEDDTVESIAQLLGGLFFDKVTDKYGDKAKGALGKLGFFKNRMGVADNLVTQGHAILNRQASLREDETGMAAKMRNFGRSLLDRSYIDTSLSNVVRGKDSGVDDPQMKRKALHTVVTIIPGLMARMHHELVKIRTGREDAPMIRFDDETGTFSDVKTIANRARSLLVGDDASYTNEGMDKIMNSALDTKNLTPNQRAALKDHMTNLVMRQMPFDPRLVATGKMPIYGNGSYEDKAALRKVFGDQYQIGRDGSLTDNDKYYQRTADVAKELGSMKYRLKDPRKEILELIDQGYTEELLAIGAVRREGNRIEIDVDRVNAMRFDSTLGVDSPSLGGAYSPSGIREMLGGGNTTINNINNFRKKKVTNNTNNSLSLTSLVQSARQDNIHFNTQNNSQFNNSSSWTKTSSGGWGNEDAYNSQYQSMALEEIIDVLKHGQELNTQHFDKIAKSVDQLAKSNLNELEGDDRYNAQYQIMVLEEIMDILQDGRQFARTDATVFNTGGFFSKQKERFRGMLGKLKGLSPKGLFNKGRDFLKTVGGGRIGNLIGKVSGNISAAKDWVKNKTFGAAEWGYEKYQDVRDWYKNGELKPALEAKLLAAKEYYDETTGKVVTRLKDVKGNIIKYGKDGLKQIVLTYEDLMEGIRDGSGKEFVAKKAKGIANWVGLKLGRPLSMLRNLRGNAMDLVMNPINKAKSFLFGLPDVYVKGEAKPRLLAIKAKNGEYINIDGSSVRTLKDIRGEVRNRNFELVLSEEDITTGLVDENGKDLTMFAPGLKGLVQRLLSIPGNLLSKIPGVKGAKKLFKGGIKQAFKRVKNRVKGFATGVMGMFSGLGGGIMSKLRGAWRSLSGADENNEQEMVNIGYAQLEVQGAILDQIVGMNKRNKKHKWDNDGSGFIDGSWRDLLASRKKKKEGKDKDGEEKKDKEDSPLMKLLKNAFGAVTGAVGGLLGGLVSGIGGAVWDAIKWLAMAMAGKVGLDSLTPGGKSRSGRRRPGGRIKPKMRGKWGAMLAAVGLGGWFGADYLMDGDDDLSGGVADNAQMEPTKPSNSKPGNSKPGSSKPSSSSTSSLRNYTRATRTGAGLMARAAASWGLRGGAAAAGLMANPYVAGAMLIGTAATIGYDIYDDSKSRPFRDMRFAQYGVNLISGNQANRYLEFENWFVENAKITADGRFTLAHLPQMEVLAAMEDTIGGVEGNMPKAFNWYSARFMPVMAGWLNATGKTRKAGEISRIDDSLSVVESRDLAPLVKDLGNNKSKIPLPGEDPTLAPELMKERIDAAYEKITGGMLAVDKNDSSVTGLYKAGLSNAIDVFTGNKETSEGEWASVLGYAKKTNIVFWGADTLVGFWQGVTDQENSTKYNDILVETGGTLDPLRSVRMKVYGLNEFKPEWVNPILRLEGELEEYVAHTGKGTAKLSGDFGGVFVNFANQIGIGSTDARGMRNASFWIEKRFTPAYLAYMAGAKLAGITDPLRAHMRDTKAKQYNAVQPMLAATANTADGEVSVWRTGLHPVMGVTANSDPSSVKGNLETLKAGMKETELSEISGERGNTRSGLQKRADKLTETVTSSRRAATEDSGWSLSKLGKTVSNWFSSDNSSALAAQQAILNQSNRGTALIGASGSGEIGAGVSVNFDPKGGKYGNVNDLPLPTSPKGFEGHKELIHAVSKMTGVDSGVLAGLFATESDFDSSAKPGTSTAKGLGQFIDGTWKAMVKNYGHLFGIKEGTSPNDPRANALMSVMYMKENAGQIKQWKQGPITDVDLYLAHFLGADGYKSLYKNQDRLAYTVNSAGAASNPNIFYEGGDKSRPRTGAQVLALQASKQIKNRNHYGPLMHSYVRSQGGTVDSSIFNQGEGVGVDTSNMGKGNGAAVTAAAETPNLPGITTIKQPTTPVLAVDGGGLPTLNSTVSSTTAASAVRTAASVGADSNVATKSTSIGTVASAPAPTVTPVVNSGVSKDSFAQETLEVGKKQLEALLTIGQGIGVLVEVALKGPNASAPPASGYRVNGRSKMPVDYTNPSST